MDAKRALDAVSSLGLAFAIAYPALWVQSFDASLQMRVYAQPDLDGPNELVADEAPSFFSLAAAGWALAVAVVFELSDTRCSLGTTPTGAVDTLISAVAVAVTAKVLVGPAGVNHKRVLLQHGGHMSRPLSWRVLDVLTPIPVNATAKLFNKLVWFPVFAGVSWVIGLFTEPKTTDDLIIPSYAFLALATLFTGRLSTIYLHRHQVPFAQRVGVSSRACWVGWPLAIILLVGLASFMLSYVLIEKLLVNCGARPNTFPAMLPFVVGIAAAPAISVALAIASGAVAHAVSSRG